MGRRVDQMPRTTRANFRPWIDRSRTNLGVDTLTSCSSTARRPPSTAPRRSTTRSTTLVGEGAIATTASAWNDRRGAGGHRARHHGQRADHPQRIPPQAARRGPARRAGRRGIIARVPLASGLLSGKYTTDTAFAEDDHRNYNRNGAAFDVGETFSGVDYATGVAAAREFTELVRDGVTTAEAALAWIIAQEGVSTVIPGARNPEQARANAAAAGVGPLPTAFHEGVRRLYDDRLRETIHPRW